MFHMAHKYSLNASFHPCIFLYNYYFVSNHPSQSMFSFLQIIFKLPNSKSSKNKKKKQFSSLFFFFFFFFLSLSSTTKVVISGIPHHANFSDVEPLLKQYGNVEECDAVASKDPKTQTVHITFESYEQAQRLLTHNSSLFLTFFLQNFFCFLSLKI